MFLKIACQKHQNVEQNKLFKIIEDNPSVTYETCRKEMISAMEIDIKIK